MVSSGNQHRKETEMATYRVEFTLTVKNEKCPGLPSSFVNATEEFSAENDVAALVEAKRYLKEDLNQSCNPEFVRLWRLVG